MQYEDMSADARAIIKELWRGSMYDRWTGALVRNEYANETQVIVHHALDRAGFEKGEARGRFIEGIENEIIGV